MPGLNIFSTRDFAYRTIITKTASYTVLVTDELVQINGSALTMTLPPLNSLAAGLEKKKSFKLSNISSLYSATIQPGTNTVTGTADTINSKALFTLMPNESIVIVGTEVGTDWSIQSPYPQPAFTRVPFQVVAAVAGTTPVNVFDANGAPTNIDITAVAYQVLTSCTGIVNVFQQGTSSIATITMNTALAIAGNIVGSASALANAAVAAGTAITVSTTGSGTGNMIIFGTMQAYS